MIRFYTCIQNSVSSIELKELLVDIVGDMGRIHMRFLRNKNNYRTFIENIYYARWAKGEIDLVHLSGASQKPYMATEVKWTDRPARDRKMLRHLQAFHDRHPGLKSCQVTTRTITEENEMENGLVVNMLPTSFEVYRVGRMLTELRDVMADFEVVEEE